MNDNKKAGAGAADSARAEADSFWDIDALMPRRRPSSPAPRSRTEPVEMDFDIPAAAPPCKAGNADVPIPPRAEDKAVDSRRWGTSWGASRSARELEKEKAEYSYCPERSLIHQVDVLRWHTGYSYYEQFYRSAVELEHKTAPECRHVQFFSYMPQYSQLNREQLGFYLWWRDEVRAGRCPHADYSYVLLYIYELINLYSGTDMAGQACEQLCRLWKAYRAEYPRLDVQLSEWVCDICLINRLPPPFELLAEIPDAPYLRAASLREFYIDCSSDDGSYASALILYCSNYDWRKSRYAVGDARKLYERHLPAAVSRALAALEAAGEASGTPRMQDSSSVRDAYIGALCTPRAKKRLRLKYCSFSRSHELRFLVTDILKYSENRLRAALGIKSRITYGPLPTSARAAVDEYFACEFPPSMRQAAARRTAEPPEYEKLYEPSPENNTLSLEHAAEIELESWQTTDRLIEAFADDAGDEAAAAPESFELPLMPEQPGSGSGDGNELAAALAEYAEFISAALGGDGGAERKFAAGRGMLPDSVADRINDIAAELFGDIILEDDGELYRVIDDYAEEVREMLEDQNGGQK